MIPVTWQQACAWHVWRDRRMVQLVAPKDGDDDNTFTVENLLADQKKVLEPSWYRWPRTIRPVPVHGPGFVMFPSRPGKVYGPRFAEMFPPPAGSIAAFQRAVVNGQVTESEFHMFDLAQLMRLFPAGNGAAGADRPDPQKAEVVTHGCRPQNESALAADAADATATDAASIGQLAEWIFERHPTNGDHAMTYDGLLREAKRDDKLGKFTRDEFTNAYRQVYETKRHRGPVTGWPLHEPYKSRLLAR